jgi:enoyl-CoA hydratase/carnithine racemase
MTDSNDLLVRREDGVLVLTFNRPEHRNALTQEMQVRLGENSPLRSSTARLAACC